MQKFTKIARFRALDSPRNMLLMKAVLGALSGKDLPCETQWGRPPTPFT